MIPLRILILHRQQSAVCYYRAKLPARALRALGHEVTIFDEPYERVMLPAPMEWVEKQSGKFDLIIIDRTLRYEELGMFAGLRHLNPGARLIVDFDDDYTSVPPWNTAYSSFQSGQQYREAGHAHLKLSEMATVSTFTLAERFASRTHFIKTAMNFIDPADWTGHPIDPSRPSDKTLRVLYGGASGHFGDLDVVKEGIEAVIDKPPVPFRLICFGTLPYWLHEASRRHPERVVSLPWIPFRDYATAVAWGGFDVAIAPLCDHPFNHAKSNIKWLEAAIQGIPFLCSNVGPYAEIPDGAAVRVPNTPVQWSEGLRALLQDAKLRQTLREEAHDAVLASWAIDRRGPLWQDVVEEAMSRPRIESLEDTRLPTERAAPPTVAASEAPDGQSAPGSPSHLP
jgi:glycosyltransferase involved in cell wall biosynthesis